MHYDQYLTNGWPIASGVIEGACRHLVKDRCELSGMRWTQAGVENLLRLRAVAENNDWTAYRSFLQAQRHQRLYNVPWPGQDVLENQAMTDPIAPLSVGHAFVMPTIVAQRNASEGSLTEPNQLCIHPNQYNTQEPSGYLHGNYLNGVR